MTQRCVNEKRVRLHTVDRKKAWWDCWLCVGASLRGLVTLDSGARRSLSRGALIAALARPNSAAIAIKVARTKRRRAMNNNRHLPLQPRLQSAPQSADPTHPKMPPSSLLAFLAVLALLNVSAVNTFETCFFSACSAQWRCCNYYRICKNDCSQYGHDEGALALLPPPPKGTGDGNLTAVLTHAEIGSYSPHGIACK